MSAVKTLVAALLPAVLVVAVLVPTALAVGQSVVIEPPAGVQGLAPAPPQPQGRPQPAIDPLSASIQGRIVTADSGAPIRRAEVRTMATSGVSRLVVTDADGRFEVRDLPAGQFRISVSKSGFITMLYGQRRPFEAAVPVDLKQGQRFTANVALPRGAAIAGRVYDDGGEPLANVRVLAMRSRVTEGRRRLEPVGAADLTDDTGSYRVYGLPPGDYYVSASPPRRQIPAPRGAPLNRPPTAADVQSTMTTFYPGTTSVADAQRVTLGVGGETRADIQIGSQRAAVVSGVVLTAAGAPAGDATVTLRSDTVAMGAASVVAGSSLLVAGQAITGHTNPDGTFELPGVPPGPYTLSAVVQDFALGVFDSGGRIQPPQGPPPTPQTASMPVVVTGADITGLTLATGRGGSAEGTFVADAGVTQPLPRGLEVTSRPVNGSDGSMRMHLGDKFQIFGLNGAAYLAVGGLPDGWAVKAMMVDGADMTDQPVDLRNGRHVNVRFVLTDRVTTVNGTVSSDALREPLERRNQNVVIFPEDSKKWTYPSRFLRAVRTDDQGAFRISALPPDERYLAVAVDFLEDGEATDPEFLERMRTRATSFSLGEAERRNIELRLIER